ncbi:MAG: hypothetical protein KJO07_25045, partial [Deltaproteobacteria bacterium]|nr:hypothetical protein [Deltaproteobacteria bacterium]
MARSKNKKSSRKKKSGARSGGKGAARARAAAQTDEPKSRSGATGAGKEPAAEKESRPRTGSQRKWLLTVAALAVLAPLVFAGVYFKVSPSRDQVFAGPEVVLLGADSYYHLRHTRAAANNGIQRYDIGTHYPTGQRSRNAAIFDSIAAIAASWTADGDSPSDDEVATALAWLPPIMAGLVLLGLFGVGLALGSRLLGLTIAAAAICYPGEMAFKMLLGFGDHHAWEAVLLVIITLALGAALHVREPRHAASWAAGAGAVLAILGLSWAGTPLLLLLFAYSPLLVATIDIAAGRAPTRARHTGAIATGAFALITAMAATLSPDSVLVPSLAWLAIAGALGVCAAFGLSAKLADWIRGRATVPRLALSLGLAVLPVLALIAAASAVPAVGAALEVVFSKVSSIAEHQGKNLWLQFGPLAAL